MKIIYVVGLVILAFIVGYGLGSYVTIKAVADIASRFIDPELVEQAVHQYKNNIGACFNATI